MPYEFPAPCSWRLPHDPHYWALNTEAYARVYPNRPALQLPAGTAEYCLGYRTPGPEARLCGAPMGTQTCKLLRHHSFECEA